MKRRTRRRLRFDSDGYESTENFDGVRMEDLVDEKDPRLPSPSEIADALKNSRVTIILDDLVISFFKEQADRFGVSYQQMIREVLRAYVGLKKGLRKKGKRAA